MARSKGWALPPGGLAVTVLAAPAGDAVQQLPLCTHSTLLLLMLLHATCYQVESILPTASKQTMMLHAVITAHLLAGMSIL